MRAFSRCCGSLPQPKTRRKNAPCRRSDGTTTTATVPTAATSRTRPPARPSLLPNALNARTKAPARRSSRRAASATASATAATARTRRAGAKMIVRRGEHKRARRRTPREPHERVALTRLAREVHDQSAELVRRQRIQEQRLVHVLRRRRVPQFVRLGARRVALVPRHLACGSETHTARGSSTGCAEGECGSLILPPSL